MKIYKRVFGIILFLSVFFLHAEQITVKFYLSNNEVYAHDFDSDITLLTLSNYLFGFEDVMEDYYIDKIEGFENFENLKFLEIKNFMNIKDFSFLYKLKNLTELYINSCLVEDITFLEKLDNLEILDMYIYIPENKINEFNSKQIDFSNHLFLFLINFKAVILLENEDSILPYDNVPLFINVQNQPILNISNNGIKTLSEDQIQLLKQYSQIIIWPNPILENEEEMEKLEKLNIVTK